MAHISLLIVIQYSSRKTWVPVRLTILGGGPLYWLAVVRTFQFLGDQFQGEYLLIYIDVRPADVHRHLWIQLLTSEAVAHDRIQVLSGVPAIPTWLLPPSVGAATLVVVIAPPPAPAQVHVHVHIRLLLGLALSLRVPLPLAAA